MRWTSKIVRKLADELHRRGHQTSHRMVTALLQEMGYSLQANRKTIKGSSHPDRDAQFEHIHQRGKAFQAADQKELQQVQIIRDPFHGEWNYTIKPHSSSEVRLNFGTSP